MKPSLIKDLFSARRTKFLVYSEDTLGYREIRFFRSGILAGGFLVALFVLGTLLIVNHQADDFLGLGYNRLSFLTTENRMLKEELKSISGRMEALQGSIEELADRGDELRLMVDLSVIDQDTRNAGVGGSQGFTELAYLSGEANEILRDSRVLIDQLTREAELQEASYREVHAKYLRNKDLFLNIPSIKPVVGAYAVHGYGMRIHPVLGIRRMHEGIDIVADVGTNVYAAADGVIRYAGRTRGGYGKVIEITHGYGYSTLYAHLSSANVRVGQKIKRGDLIGRSGRTGLVSGPHLHYEVRRSGRKMDPVDYFFDDVDPVTYRRNLSVIGG